MVVVGRGGSGGWRWADAVGLGSSGPLCRRPLAGWGRQGGELGVEAQGGGRRWSGG
jgi:hypothetical protein